MLNSINVTRERKITPWKIATLSFIIPGAGQFYIGAFASGIAILLTTLLLEFLSVFFLLSESFPFKWYLIALFLSIVLGYIATPIISYKQAEKLCDGGREYKYTFFTLLFPGLGHLIAGRKLKGAFFILTSLIAFLFMGNIAFLPFFAVLLAASTYSTMKFDMLKFEGRVSRLFLCFLILGVPAQLLVSTVLENYLVEIKTVRSVPRDSGPNKMLVINKIKYLSYSPQKGDVVAFRSCYQYGLTGANIQKQIEFGIVVLTPSEKCQVKKDAVTVGETRYIYFNDELLKHCPNENGCELTVPESSYLIARFIGFGNKRCYLTLVRNEEIVGNVVKEFTMPSLGD